MAERERRERNLVVRADGKTVNVARKVGHLFVCETGCCCGIVERGYAAHDSTVTVIGASAGHNVFTYGCETGAEILDHFAARTGFPVRMRSRACAIPMSRGSRCVPPAPGMTPSWTSG